MAHRRKTPFAWRPSAQRPRRVPGRRGRVALLLVAAVVVVLGGYVAVQAVRATSALTDAADQAKTLQQQVSDGDSTGATETLEQLQASTSTARSTTGGPLWGALTKVPFVGDSVSAVRTISTSLDDISQRGLPPVVAASSSLDADVFKPRDGRVDLAQLTKLAPSVTTASDVLTTNQATISAIDSDALVGPLQGPVADLKDKIDSAQSTASAGSRAMQLLPGMLGSEGERTYLLMFQNNAEARATGGLPGAFAIVRAKDGRVTITGQGSSSDIPQLDEPVIALTRDEREAYGDLMATDFRDTNFTPDFPRTAQIARALVKDRLGTEVSGVLSMDPVALSYLLRGTGPLTGADGTTLTSDNAVSLLLNDVYARYPEPEAQDAFFAESARRVFDAVTDGRGNSRTVLDNLVRSSAEHRVLLWSSVPAEQRLIQPTRLAGSFVGTSDHPQVGVYLNDQTSSKMQYYLDTRTRVKSTRCTAAGSQVLEASTTLTSTAPADASELPEYIVGTGQFAAEGTMVMDVRTFAPVGGTLLSVKIGDQLQALNASALDGRPMQFASITLKPGQTVSITTVMQTADDQRDDAEVSTTPGVQPTPNGVLVRSACR